MRTNTPKYLIVHHTGGTDLNPLADTSSHTFEMVNEWHRYNPNVWLGEYGSLGYAIGYHYFIDKTGKTTQGRAHTDEGAHTVGYNASSLGICLAGNFDVTLPTPEQEKALKTLLGALKGSYPDAPIIPHRHFAQKSCYGRKLSDTWASDLILKIDPIQCKAEKDTIIEQKKQISRLQELINTVMAYLRSA